MNRTSGSVFINRELSWMEFNQRVLEAAQQTTIPPLERLKFLSITGSNLDEFFMVRVGELQTLADENYNRKDRSGYTPRRLLSAIAERAHAFARRQKSCFETISSLLSREGIVRLRASELSPRQARHAKRVFETEVFPVVSPIAVAASNRFPLLTGTMLHVGVFRSSPAKRGATGFAVIPLPKALDRIIALPSEKGYCYLLLEDLIEMYGFLLFPGEEILECVSFRVTRNAALKAEDEFAADLLVEMTEIITRRRRSECVRMEISGKATPRMIAFLQKGLRLPKDSIYRIEGCIDYTAFMRLTQLPGFVDLKDESWPPIPLLSLKPGTTMFEAIRRGDILLHHPYESYEPVLRFVEEAADDPGVISIKQTLYRTSRKSRIVAALARAAEKGKYVTAIVELKARFDEERNIGWARDLEDAGVQVVYGVKGYKTHAKACCIIRKETGGIKKYVHFGTGNYNEITARLYTDISLLTCNEDLADDASAFFNMITGHTQPGGFRRIAAAPIDLRETLLALIEAETENARRGGPAFIRAKLNALVDTAIIDALSAASRAGVEITLAVRGICCLRPGLKGISDNIAVTSVIDRFLEHSRIVWFHGGGAEKVFFSSADWMPRNLDKRCELLIPLDTPDCRKLCMEILDTSLRDTAQAWMLLPDGQYRRLSGGGRKALRSQEVFYRRASATAMRLRRRRRTIFEAHRPKGTT